jgi:hypothetical protein
MDSKQIDQFIKAMLEMTPEDNAKLCAEIMNATKERLLRDSEVFSVRAKELNEFIKNRLP